MRRVVSTVMVASGVLGLSLGLVGASLGFGADAASAAAGKKVCAITNPLLSELSGMIATRTGYVVVNDSSDDAERRRVFILDSRCKVTKSIAYSGSGPRDPEDLALSPDGRTAWIADIGDNVGGERRDSVVLWSMPITGASKPVLHRLAYPGGKPHDAEALLIGADGVPLIITKTTGKAEIYRPTAALKKSNAVGVPMAKVGEIELPKTVTANVFGPAGRLSITGAARSPDGNRVALRTYADAFEWDVQGGDLVKALTTAVPRVTTLADPFGESIAYAPDGKTFVTVSDAGDLDEGTELAILSYAPAQQVAPPIDKASGGSKEEAEESWTQSLTLDDITYLIAAVGVLGAILVGLGVVGIIRARRRPGEEGKGARGPGGDDLDPRVGRQAVPDDDIDTSRGWGPYDRPDESGRGPSSGGGYRSDRPADDYESAGRGRRPAGAPGVYGGGPAGGKLAGGPGVYGGGKPAGGPGVYGGGKPAGGPGVYGGGKPAGGPGVYGGQPVAGATGRPGGGVYGAPPAGGAYRGGPGGRPGPERGGRPEPGYGDARGGHYGQPQQRRAGYPDDSDYR